MSSLGIWAGIAQLFVVLVGGGWTVWKFAQQQGRKEEKLDRIIKQVEPNNGTSLRDDVHRLREDFHRFSQDIEQRVRAVERRP